jgi:glycosyltransferase involved in cell wall biosynthesis
MRLHVVNLPHTNTTRAYSTCAYTTKVRQFCDMMATDYPVTLYGGDETEATCDEFVPAGKVRPPELYLSVDWDPAGPDFGPYNMVVAKEIIDRYEVGDVVCLITGRPHAVLRHMLPMATFVEFGIGYEGVAFGNLVFESHAWRHAVMGWQMTAAGADGNPNHAVIGNYFPLEEFPFVENPDGDYVVYLGRFTQRKGWRIAQSAAELAGVEFVCAGPLGDDPFSGYGHYLGVIDPDVRAMILGNARATLCPTRYLEPFCSVHVESMLYGTPVITSDWGVFTETVDGYNGLRVRRDQDWPAALSDVKSCSRLWAREYAVAQFSYDAIRPLYVDYLETLREGVTVTPSEDVKPEDTNPPADETTDETTEGETTEADETAEEAPKSKK